MLSLEAVVAFITLGHNSSSPRQHHTRRVLFFGLLNQCFLCAIIIDSGTGVNIYICNGETLCFC